VVPDGGGDEVKLGADLPIGAPGDEQLEDLGFALREPNRVTDRRRRP